MDTQQTRLPRIVYPLRVALFAYAAVALLVATHGEERALTFWAYWTVAFLLYPQAAYWRACHAKDPKRTELQHIDVDAFIIGVGAAFGHYLLSIVVLFLGASLLTHISLGGARAAARAVALFLIGALLGGVFTGYHMALDGSLADEAVGFGGVVLVAIVVGYTGFRQNKYLLRIKQAIEDKRRILQGLLRSSLVAHTTSSVDDLIAASLDHFEQLMPDLGFGVVLHDDGRVGTVRHVLFRAISPADGRPLIERLKHIQYSEDQFQELGCLGTNRVWALPMSGHLKQLGGVFLVKSGADLSADRRDALHLFRDQLASTLESRLLTLKLQRLAETDALTGVHNRAYFNTALAQAIDNKLGVASKDFTILVVDVNGLKAVNDSYGHPAGDQVIVHTARALQNATRAGDVVARVGGDEFYVLCNNCDAAEAVLVAQRIRSATAKTQVTVTQADGKRLTLPLRVGIGRASSDEEEVHKLIPTADERMYRDKERSYRREARPR